MSEVIFPKGISFKLPRENAPEFVKGTISIKREELLAELLNRQEEWLNYDCLISKNGKGYLKENTYKKENKEEKNTDNIPF